MNNTYKVKRVSCSEWSAWAVYVVKNRTTIILAYFDSKLDAIKRAQELNTSRPTKREPDSLKAGDSSLPDVVKSESNLPA